jgi:glycosyltransferase involved in cell wall biosynthesis
VATMSETAVQRARFLIIGDRPGDYSDRLRRAFENLPQARRERVAIVPETEALEYFAAADVAVCTSRTESYPLVVLEAMAFGLPLVTTPVWGVREQVREDVNALWYPPGDIPVLASKLARIIENDDLRSSLARNAKPVLESLPSYEEMLSRYAAIFRESQLTR